MKMNAVRFMRSKKPRQPEEMEKKVSERHDEVDLPRDSAGLMGELFTVVARILR